MTIGAAEPIFIDTNVLVFANAAAAPFHQIALTALHRIADTGHEICISRQVLREYLATVTRQQEFQNPLPIETAVARVEYFQTQFRIAEEGPAVTARLLHLVRQVPTGGRQIHDANIVATMLAHGIGQLLTHGIGQLLTHNVADFARYSAFVTVLPLDES